MLMTENGQWSCNCLVSFFLLVNPIARRYKKNHALQLENVVEDTPVDITVSSWLVDVANSLALVTITENRNFDKVIKQDLCYVNYSYILSNHYKAESPDAL